MPLPPIIVAPGWGDSGPAHWQTLMCEKLPCAVRVEQDDWQRPYRRDWVDRLAHTIEQQAAPVLVVAHSLGRITTAHLPAFSQRLIRAALLVAPANPNSCLELSSFAPVPQQKLPFPSVVVASTNDPYCAVPLARAWAADWGSELLLLYQAGHINVESGYGPWPLALTLLESLNQRTAALTSVSSISRAMPQRGDVLQASNAVAGMCTGT